MGETLCPPHLAAEAVYLAVLAARGVKPLSRIEYAVGTPVLRCFTDLGLLTAVVTRVARDGTRVRHLAVSRDAHTLRDYRDEFDGRLLRGETPAVIRREAHYFGYPACCAESYIRAPHAPNNLPDGDQSLLFHHVCRGCRVTPRLIPHYRAALAEAERLTAETSRRSRFQRDIVALRVVTLET